MAALDFEMDISAGGPDGYPVSVRAPNGGEATSTMSLPTHALNILAARISDAVLISAAAVRRPTAAGEQPVRELGMLLFDALFSDQVRGLLIAAKHSAADGETLRLVLRVDPPELAVLPWEFLFDRGEDDYLCLSTPVIRWPRVLHPVSRQRVEPPLRVLAMAASPADQQELAVDDEHDRLRAALAPLQQARLVELAFVDGQSWRALRDAVAGGGPWHVLHFTGHGIFDSEAGEGAVVLADGDGSAHHLPASDLARLLKGHSSLRLAVLNACDTGRVSTLGPFSSVAGSLIQGGVPAVVAMQFAITDEAAATASEAFYEGLAAQLPVDAALTRARQAVRIEGHGSLEWGTPVLYMHSADGRLFDFTTAPAVITPQAQPRARLPDAASEGEISRLYNDALDAYYTERWDDAISLFQAIVSRDDTYRDARLKLDQSRQEQQNATVYAAARGAADAGAWEDAIRDFETVFSADPGYRDVKARLDYARRQHTAAWLGAEIRRLHAAGQWEAVIEAGAKLAALGPGLGDPDGLVTEAQLEISNRARTDDLSHGYDRARDQLSSGDWRNALRTLEGIAAIDPGYREIVGLSARARRELCRTIGLHDEPVLLHTFPSASGFAFSHDTRFFAYGTESKTFVISLPGGEERFSTDEGTTAVALNADGSQLATCNGQTISIWDIAAGWVALTLKLRNGEKIIATALSFSPDGHRLAAGRTGKGVEIWDTVNARRLSIVAQDVRVSQFAFSPDGTLAIAGAAWGHRYIAVWDVSSYRPKKLRDGGTCVAAFSADGRYRAAAGGGGTVRIWHRASGRETQAVKQEGEVLLVALSPDGTWLATVSVTGPPQQSCALRLWDAESGCMLLESSRRFGTDWTGFSPDGTLAVSSRGPVQIWQLRRPGSD
jgi:WD40 repeat protein